MSNFIARLDELWNRLTNNKHRIAMFTKLEKDLIRLSKDESISVRRKVASNNFCPVGVQSFR